ncbi:MAG: hypothetical protein GX800_09185 [Clostridiaceae bacterium]|nr:hypothetical protein [Clostridiaceae bacterium]
MLKIRKIVSILLSLFMIMQIINIRIYAMTKIFDTDVIFEAENGIINNAISVVHDERASNGAYAVCKTKAVTKIKDIGLEDLSWMVDIKKTGEYYIFMRIYNQASLFYRFNGNDWAKKDLDSTPNGPKWVQLDIAALNKGINTLRIHHCNTNGWLDALYITENPETLPQTIDGVKSFETTETKSRYSVVSPQKKEYSLNSSLVIEAEDATVCSPYVFVSSKAASGMKGIKSTGSTSKAEAPGTQGHVEFRFKCEKTGIYSFWLRTLATASNQDSVYVAINNEPYVFMEYTISDDFVWKKSLSANLSEGEDCVFRIYAREANAIVDNVLITDKRFTPTGRVGNIPDETAASSISAHYEAPPITPPEEHPRVLFRKSDIERIKTNMDKPQNSAAKRKLMGQLSSPVTGEISNKYDAGMLAKIEAFAFDYAINNKLQSGEIAVNAILNYLDGSSVEDGNTDWVTRQGGHIIYVASEVYDWCYELLSNKQKLSIISACESLADLMEIGWPPTRQGSVVGHGSEAQLLRCMLAFAIAVYDERPDIWEVVGGRFYQEYVPARNYLNVGHYSSQGDSYGLYRHIWDSWSHLLIKGMGAEDPYITSDLYQVSYNAIYMRRPDGQLIRDGDSASDTANPMWTYWNDRANSFLLDSAIGNDPYLKNELARQAKNMAYFYESSAIMYLIINNPDLEPKSIYNLPLSRYFPYPAGISVARTGWEDGVDSPAVVAEMKIGGVAVNNHQHADAGHFQIYYKGILASDSGVYQGADNKTTYGSLHYNLYMTKSIAHNTMLIYDPSEPTAGSTSRNNILDGGQRAANNANEPINIDGVLKSDAQVAKIEGQEIDLLDKDKPAYTYLKGDLTDAYSNKVKNFKRSFMFLNLFDEKVPAALIVFDKVTASNPTFKKTWLLHGLEEPQINENQTIFRRTYKSSVYPNQYNGKMTVDTLLPNKDQALITKIGGADGFSNVNGVDYTGKPANTASDEGSTWRIELSPKNASATDYFLNVIQVSDNDKDYYLETKLIDSDKYYGAVISDRVVMFSKSGERESGKISFNAGAGKKIKYTVCDAESGTWRVTTTDGEQNVYVTPEGGVISISATGGDFVAEYLGSENTAEQLQDENGEKQEIINYNLKTEGFYIYTAGKMKMQNGSMMLGLDIFEKYFGITGEVNSGRIYIKKNKNTAELTVGSNIAVNNGKQTELSQPVIEENGSIFLPLRSVAEMMEIDVEWDEYSKTVFLTPPPEDYSLPEQGYAKFESVTHDTGEVDDENYAENSIDGNFDTIWAALGKGRYVDYKLDKSYLIKNAEVLFNPNGSRNAEFDIMVSQDGINFTMVYSGKSDGSIEKPIWEKFEFTKPVSARFVRYVANGSNISEWNAIKEIRFAIVQ